MLSELIYMGVDPGFSGGIGILHPTLGVLTYDMPVKKMGKGVGYNALDLESLCMIFRMFPADAIRVGLENPTTRPGEGAERCFRFGRQIGNIEAILHVIGCNYTLIPPATWTNKLGFPGKQYDNAIEIRASWWDQHYPDAAALIRGPRGGILDGRLDALLISHYLKQVSGVLGKFGRRPPKFTGGGFDPFDKA